MGVEFFEQRRQLLELLDVLKRRPSIVRVDDEVERVDERRYLVVREVDRAGTARGFLSHAEGKPAN